MSIETALETLIKTLPPTSGKRRLIAVAGPPASGKTTLAKALANHLPDAAFVPMDGFHLDDTLLKARGDHARKGAPHTFDVGGFASLMHRLQAGEDVIAPIFDRSREISIAGALHIPTSAINVVVEGNYLLYDAPLWRDLAPLWDYSVFLDVPEDVLEARLLERWERFGHDPAAARAKAESNDLPNARSVVTHRLAADLVLDVNGTRARYS